MTFTSVPLRTAAAPAGWAGLRDFFAYHGVWAIGVRLLRQMSVRGKIMLVMGILLAPVGPMAWHIVSAENATVALTSERLARLRSGAIGVDDLGDFTQRAIQAQAGLVPGDLAALQARVADAHRLVQARLAADPELQRLRASETAALQPLLEAELAAAERTRATVAAALAAALALSLYLLYCFFLVMRGGLLQLNQQMNRMAQGDLSARLSPLGVDEVALTMNAMSAALVRLSDLLGSVQLGVGAVSQASQQIASGNGELSGRSRDTAASLAVLVEGVARYSAQLEACGRQVESVVGTVQALRLESARNRKQMQRLRERMTALRGKSHEIGEIVTLIDHIAFRTNILALNASVEASKAGEAGRGFAVVAQEVRSLALRGAESARRIGDIVTRSTDDIEHSSALADETGKALATADERVDQIHLAMDDVAALTRSGETESGAILEQLTQIKDGTAQNLRLVDQLAGASDALRSQGERLTQQVGQFRLS